MSASKLSDSRQKLLFWSAAVLIGLSIVLALVSAQRLSALSERANQSHRLTSEVSQLLASLQDVGSGARAFVLTRDRRVLESYNHGLAALRQSEVRLRATQSALPEYSLSIDRLLGAADARADLSRQLVTAVTLDDSSAETAPLVRGGETALNDVRRHSRAILSTETVNYDRMSRAIRSQSLGAHLFMGVAGALSLGIIAWLFSSRGREVVRRRQVEADLRALNSELEDRVQERTAEVQRTKDLLNIVVENMPDMVFLKEAGKDHRYLLINQAGEQLLGLDRQEVIGRIDHELFPRDQAALCLEEDRAVTETRRQRVQPERKISTVQGERLVESRKVPISHGDGEQALVLGIVRDVTEQKRLEGQLRQMQRMDAVGRLTGGVAHDFNNLLAIISGNAELVREQLNDGSEAAAMADEVIEAASRGAELVRRLLAFARMQHLEPRPVNLNERLPSITGLLRRSLGENVDLVVRPSLELWPALIDPTQVDDALVNLTINARDAMPDGGTLTIETDNVVLEEDYAAHHVEVTPGDYVMLAVSDTGTGMSSEVIARAFEPFFTTKEEGKGTGLGLSQVYGWVKQSNGHIKIYSEIGFGTTIKLYLPRARQNALESSANDEGALPRGDETILVVEDNPKVRQTVLRQLADLGYATVEASNGAEAIDLVRQGPRFDMLLTDIVMPGGITGYELAEQLATLRPGLKVLFTSGYTELGSAGTQAIKRGSFLSKPYRKKELGLAVRRILDSDPLDIEESNTQI